MSGGLDAAREMAELIANASFRQYAKTFIKIENELGEVVPLDLNEAQDIVYEEIERQRLAARPIRLLILKGRQQGMSTFCQAYIAWKALTHPGARCLTVGHQLPAVHELFGKFDRIIKELPVIPEIGLAKPEVEDREKGRRIRFADPLRSQYRADSAQEPESVGRGMTIQYAHLTEVPQWAKADETMQAVLATVPDHPNTIVLVETTAKGATGWFYETWMKAIRAMERGEEPEFVPVFVPWFKTQRYQRKRRPGEPGLDVAETRFRDKYNLTNEQVYWYRDQREKYGERVTEEYPSNWQEAFLSSGMPFFRREDLKFYRERMRKPWRKGVFRLRRQGDRKIGKFLDEDFGPTHLFEAKVDGHRYSVGIDFASGRAADSSAIVVIDADTKRVVATHASKLLPDEVLSEAVLLARYYNDALIVPERSGIGQALVDTLVNTIGYTNVYREEDPVAVKFHHGARYGWATSNRTRSWLLEEMAHLVHYRELDIPCKRLVEEMGTFVYLKPDYAAADPSSHDDLVMAMAIAVRGLASLPSISVDVDVDDDDDYWNPAISSRTGY